MEIECRKQTVDQVETLVGVELRDGAVHVVDAVGRFVLGVVDEPALVSTPTPEVARFTNSRRFVPVPQPMSSTRPWSGSRPDRNSVSPSRSRKSFLMTS